MSTDQKFADYVLFEKLSATAFGDCFRAGRVVGSVVESHALLQLFNGSSLDGDSFWQLVADRRPLVDNLKDPHLGECIAFDRFESIPYAAYSYTPGRSLDLFLAAVRSQEIPVPVDQALFIIERAALGLTAAHQVSHRGRPVLHGFLVPDLIRLSSEGEIRVVGIEAAPGLRSQLAKHPAFAAYLAPEVRAGEAPTETDDVFSLGSVLFHLLTGTPLAAERAHEAPAVIEEATLAGGEQPLPPVIKDFLQNSLAPRAKRIPNAVSWQQVLGRVILDGEYNPTTFNLSFLMHTIFREDLEAELLRMPRELAYRLPAASTDEIEAAPPEDGPTETPITGLYARASGRPFLSGFVVSFCAAVMLIGAYFALAHGQGNAATVEAVEPVFAAPEHAHAGANATEFPAEFPADDAQDLLDAVPPPPDTDDAVQEAIEEDPETQLVELVASRQQDLEASIRAEYESRIQALEQQLEATNAAETSRQLREAAPPERDLAAVTSQSPATSESENLPRPTTETAAAEQASTSSASTPTPALPGESNAEPGGGTEETALAERSDDDGASSEAAAAPTISETVVFEPPKLQSPPRPKYPAAARRLRRSASVQVRVLVGTDGRVSETELPGPAAGLGFDSAAEAAARRSRWTPAARNGVPVESWALLTIEFQP